MGLCPAKTCRAFRKGNTVASKHDGRARLTPADLNARDALVGRLFAERGGRESLDIVSQLRVEDFCTASVQLGKVTRRLEALGAVSAAGSERKSLVATYTTFSARVERLAAELPPPRTRTPTDGPDVEVTLDELEARATMLLRLVNELRQNDEMRTIETLEINPGDPPPADVPYKRTPAPDDSYLVLEPGDPGCEAQEARHATAVHEPTAAEPTCSYGCGSLARCTELKATRPDNWRVLHYDDPQEVTRRDAEATAVMFKMLGKQSPYL